MFTIPHEANHLFRFFYILSCAAGSLIVYRELRKRDFTVQISLLVIAVCLLGGIAGTRFFPFLLEFLQSGGLGPARTKSALGGIAGLLAGAGIMRLLLGLRASLTECFASAWLILLAIARLGCLAAGCCHGSPSDGILSLHYEAGSIVHDWQHGAGLIAPGENPLPVHPVQLYEIAFLLLLALIVPRLRRIVSGGTVFYATLAGYGIFRFCIEFIRVSEKSVFGLSQAQFVLAFAVPAILLWILLRERRAAGPALSGRFAEGGGIFRVYPYFFLVFLLFLSLTTWFSALEAFTLNLIILALVSLLAIPALRKLPSPSLRIGAGVLPLGIFLLMGAADSSYYSFGLSGFTGAYENTESECGGPSRTTQFRFEGAGLETGVRNISESGSFGIGLGFFYNNVRMTSEAIRDPEGRVPETLSTGGLPVLSLYGINPRITGDIYWAGLGLGAFISVLDGDPNVFLGDSTEMYRRRIITIPQYWLRLGPRDIFFAELGNPDFVPQNSVRPLYALSFGSGFGEEDASMLRAGFMGARSGLATGSGASSGSTATGYFINPRFVLNNGLVIDPFAFFTGRREEYQLSLRLQYRMKQ